MQRQKLPEMPSRISLLGWIRVVVEQVDRRHDHAGRAVAALQAMLLPEAVLQRMQLAVLGEPLDRGDLRAVGLHREDRARFGAAAVDEDRARTALAGIAADVRAGEIQLLAEEVHEKCSRLDVRFAHLAVHFDRNLGHGVPRRTP